MGKSSYHFNFLAQVKHFDRPETMDWPVFNRNMTTLIKLPTTAPKRKKKMRKTILVICFIIPQKILRRPSEDFFAKLSNGLLRFYVVD